MERRTKYNLPKWRQEFLAEHEADHNTTAVRRADEKHEHDGEG